MPLESRYWPSISRIAKGRVPSTGLLHQLPRIPQRYPGTSTEQETEQKHFSCRQGASPYKRATGRDPGPRSRVADRRTDSCGAG